MAATSIPYVVYLIVAWDERELDYDGTLINILSTPITMQLKLKPFITSAIALDRIQAIRFPFYYRTKKHRRYAAMAVSFGLALALVNAAQPFVMGYAKRKIGCPAAACFAIDASVYWAFSNTVLNFPMFILMIVLVLSLNKIAAPSAFEIRVMQANKLILTILLMSIFLLLIPSCIVFADQFYSFAALFYKLGPFYMFGLLLEGISNSFAYLTLHREIRDTARSMFCGSSVEQMSTPTTFII